MIFKHIPLISKLLQKKIFFGILLLILLFHCFTSLFIYFLYSRILSTKIECIKIQENLYQYYVKVYNTKQNNKKPIEFHKISTTFENNLSSLLNGGIVLLGINNDESIHIKATSNLKLRKLLLSIEAKWKYLKDFIASKSSYKLNFNDRIIFIEKNNSIHKDFNDVISIYKKKFKQNFLYLTFLQIILSLFGIILLFFTFIKYSKLAMSEKKINSYLRYEKKADDIHKKDVKEINELYRSNKELEGFAHIASHDLKEPLRMVTSYAELLHEQYENKIDKKCNMYIHYIVDGATRMQVLIEDLLSYSCVKTHEYNFESLNLSKILESVKSNLKMMIVENDVKIKSGIFPEIKGDRIQFIQLLQNLFSNAIKYRRPDVNPIITFNVERSGENYLFSVQDNGIGIDAKFFDRIFIVFQRLHKKTDIDGSGIGLAIAKNIVAKHGGKIWVTSKLNEGSIFYFTIPVNLRKI